MPTDSDALYLLVLEAAPVAGVGLEITVYDGANLATELAQLENATNIGIQLQLNAVGSGTFSINRHDAKATDAILAEGNYVKVKLGGVDRFGFFIEEIEDVAASPDGQTKELKKVSGRGGLAYIERAEIYPVGYPVASALDVPYTAQPRAAVLVDQLTQAQARGSLPSVTFDFTALVDSRARPWTDFSDQTYKVGTDLVSLALQLAATGGCDVAMDPALVLHAFVEQSRDFSQSVIFRQGRHLGRADTTHKRHFVPYRTRVLVEGASGALLEVSDPAAEANPRIGRREGYLRASQAADAQAMSDAGTGALGALDAESEPIQLQVEHGTDPGNYEPFLDYDLGDYVGIDVPDFGPLQQASFRIVSMTIGSTESGDYSVTLDLNSVFLEAVLRLQNQLQGSVATSGGGAASISSSGGSATGDGRVAVSAGDSLDFLLAKLQAGPGITIGGVGPVPGELVEISSTALVNPMNTKGDVIAGAAAGVATRLPAGTDGQVLTARGSASLGVDWETPTTGGSSDANEDRASTLVNATSPGDAGNRADHFLGSSLSAAWTAYGAGTQVVKNSSLGMHSTGSNNDSGVYSPYTPSGALRVECRLRGQGGLEVTDTFSSWGVVNSVGVSVFAGGVMRQYSRDGGAYTVRNSFTCDDNVGYIYLRLDRDGANNWTAYFSYDRADWVQIGTWAKTFTAARLATNTFTQNQPKAFDFIDVVS